MNLIFLGPPGVGKGTQAKHICEYYNILHLSTGDILRNEIKNASKIGLTAKSFIDKGALVPDNVLLDLIDSRLNKHDAQSGYILDGFPRTIAQAEGLNNLMGEKSHHLDAVISLTADEEELINRLIKRGKDSGRSDDTPTIIKQRQKVYWKQTSPLIDYYIKKNVLLEIDGLGTVPEITDRIVLAISSNA